MREGPGRPLTHNQMRLHPRPMQHLQDAHAEDSSRRAGYTDNEPLRFRMLHTWPYFPTMLTKKKRPDVNRPAFGWQLQRLAAIRFRYATAVVYFSIIRVIDSLLVAPTTRSTSLPSRKRIRVGMPLMPYRWAVEGLSSTLSFTTLAVSEYC